MDAFVGRERERDLLSAAAVDAAAGRGRMVLVAGEPGAGKTRLAEETTAASGLRRGWGRAVEDDGSPAYWPFTQAMRAVGAQLCEVPARPDQRPESAAQERFARFEAVLDALRAAAEPDGLQIVLDDMQWADPASLGLLVHVARGVAGTRLLVVATYRDTETSDPLRAALAAVAAEPAVARVRLDGFTEPEVAAQLAQVTGWAVPGPVAAAVLARTGGNPFFVRELGHVLAASSDGRLPDGVRDAVRGRLARLSPACRDLLAGAAVLGAAIDPAAIATATGSALPAVLEALDEAGAAGIVAGGRFAHDLIREAARLDVPTARRLDLHLAMAGYLEGRPDADSHLTEIAHHRLDALPAGDPNAAVAAARRAAEVATSRLAWEEAETLYRRAIDLAGPPPDVRSAMLIDRAEAQIRAYDVEGSRASLLAAAEIARGRGDAGTIARAVLVMEGVTDFLWDDTGRGLCEEALAGLPEDDSPLRARLLAAMVVANIWRAPADAKDRAAEALAMAERTGDRRAIGEALRAGQLAHSDPDGARYRLSLADRLFAVGDAVGDDDARMWGQLWRFDACAQLGDMDGVEIAAANVAVIAERMRSPLASWHSLRCRGTVAVARGRFAEGIECGERQVALARRAGHEGSLLPSLGFVLVVQSHVGGPETQLDPLLNSYFHNTATASMRGAQARWRLAIGDRAGAAALYRSLPPIEEIPPFIKLVAMAGMIELAATFDDREFAAVVYRELAPWADLFVCGGAGAILIEGSVRLPLGQAAATLGRLEDAIGHFRAAIEIDDRAGLPAVAAYVRMQLAEVLVRRRRPGDRQEAAALATTAGAKARELGMKPLATSADRLLAELAGRSPDGLSERERQIAVHVAQGLTNRQIAAAEHISARTVETHVRHIFTKLGLSTRSQLAAWHFGTRQ